MRLDRKKAILIKQETTQGTAVTPSASTDGLLVSGLEFNFDPEQLGRDYYRASIDTVASVTGRRTASVKFTAELKGSGTRGTVAVAGYTALDAAIQACGFTSTASPATSITYAPTSSPASGSFFGPGKSVTIEAYIDGMKHQLAGCVGTFKYTAEVSAYPKLEFEFFGSYVAPTDVAVPSVTIVDVLPVVWENSSITIHGSSTVIVSKFEYDVAAKAVRRDDPRVANAVKGFVITERDPKGSVEFEAELVASFDAFGKVIGNTLASTSIAHGSTSGNIVTLTWPKTQIVNNGYGNKEGILTYTSELAFRANTGDDHVGIVVT